MGKLVLRVTGPGGARQGTSEHDPDGVIVGSGAAAAVRLEDPNVSALHCLIKLERGQLTIIDLGSVSGTRVGGRAILGPTVLETGALVELGASQLEVFDAAPDAGSARRPSPSRIAAVPGAEPARCWESLWREEPSPQEEPLARARQFEAALFWGDALLDLRHFDAGRVDLSCLGQRDPQDMGARVEPLLAMLSPDGCSLMLPACADVTMRRGGQEKSVQELAHEGALLGGPDAPLRSLSMQLHDRVRVGLSGLSLVLRFVRPQGLPRGGSPRFDATFAIIVTTAALTWVALLAALLWVAPFAERPEPLPREPQRWAKYILKPPTPIAPKSVAKTQEQPPDKAEEVKVAHTARGGKVPGRGQGLLGDEHRRRAMTAGLLAYLGGGAGAASNTVLAPGGLGPGLNEALGSIKEGGGVGQSQAIVGLGSRGTGPGGGGLGLGGLGTRGGEGRGGGGGPGFGMNLAAARARTETRVVPGKTTFTGSCERGVIGKTIGRHANEVRYCYEVELNKEPSLAGKVSVSFSIDPSGVVGEASVFQSTLGNANVEQCLLSRIRRWKFPEPKGGGVCIINYPWVFRAAGHGGDEASAE